MIKVCRIPMRDWNYYDKDANAFNIMKFVEYLWGIETIFIHFWVIQPISFVEYLWGIETKI